MNYEEKYKQALERASKLRVQNPFDTVGQKVEHIFPELKENENEKIRKDILCYFEHYVHDINGIDVQKWINWLEKQGEKPQGKTALEAINEEKVDNQNCVKPVDKVKPKFKPGDTMRTWQEAANGYTDGMPVVVSIDNEYYHCTNELIAIKDQDNYEFPPINIKQKSSDKVESKFNEGDYIVPNIVPNNDATLEIWRVINIDKDGYYNIQCTTNPEYDEMYRVPGFIIEEDYRLWTIADAKDGDVLAINWHEDDDSWEKIIIFKKYHNKGVKGLHSMPCVEGYGNTFKNGKLAFQEEITYYSKTWTTNLHPATKKQRDLLFQKMKEAGWEWNVDKKEFKKIEAVCKDSDDDKICKNIIELIKQSSQVLNKQNQKDMLDWLWRQIEQKPAWNEEDSVRLQRIIDFLWHNRKGDSDGIYQQEQDIYWLKSIKDRYTWKPSDKQLNVLHDAAIYIKQSMFPCPKDMLMDLYKQLKKLSE